MWTRIEVWEWKVEEVTGEGSGVDSQETSKRKEEGFLLMGTGVFNDHLVKRVLLKIAFARICCHPLLKT
jgi:hypothetical protein